MYSTAALATVKIEVRMLWDEGFYRAVHILPGS